MFVEDEEIETTPTHPFWVIGKGWVAAGDMEVGDKVYLYSGDAREIKELKFEHLDSPIKVYNFEVEDWHTYFVSEQDVFVHNACGGKGADGKGRTGNKLKPDAEATGPHTTFKRDPNTGKITNYETWGKTDPRNPNPFESKIRFDGTGKPHFNKVTGEKLLPHVHDKTILGGVREPFLWEIPFGY